MSVVDCHAHITSQNDRRYQPKDKPLRPPKGVGDSEDLRKTSVAAGVTRVRAIQTVSYYGYDNRYLCDEAKRHAAWMTGVCTLDPDDPHSPLDLRRFIREYNVKALRSIPSNRTRTFDHAGVRALWKVVAEEGVKVDLFLMQRPHIEGAVKLLEEFPGVTVGFCHCMDLKPGPQLKENLAAVLSLARFPKLYPKVDFIGTGTQESYPCEDLHETMMAVIRGYGAERCLWASSYPNQVWTPRITYGQHLQIFREALPLTAKERALILGENADRLGF